ncbi:MAG: nickel pincer cofactor biosynthesis protein LarC [Planctomycetes bacterium]|nr:nickel pincer cofactor biosynthesis protein LarC [Planctomycetota bacterium]
MTVAYFDCFSGASGDMILGALIDAGADVEHIGRQLAGMSIAGCSVSAAKVVKQGLAATQVTVPGESAESAPHRHLETIRQIIQDSDLSEQVRARAIAVFQRLAEAEAAVHGCSIEEVHFHEVGAVDAIADIVGAMVALEDLGVERVVCSPLVVGSGTVRCAHGELPIPAPATANLLRGVPLADCDEPGELTTPTGAAILTTLAESFGPLPAMTIERIGYGAGRREGRNRPNLLRVMLGRPLAELETDEIVVLEANLDDASPEVVGYCLERLLEAGVLDAYVVPIYMKKSRPAVLLTVLSETGRVAEIERIIFAETTTLGVRRHRARRTKLARTVERVETPYGPIGVKVGRWGDELMTTAPEYEDCRAAAKQHEVPLRAVMDAALRAWQQRSG